MKKLGFIIFILAQQLAVAQTKSSISILPLSYDAENVDKGTASLMQETIINAFFSTKNFTIVDRERLEDVEKEKKLQKTEAFMDNNTDIKSGVNIGASYLISPSLISLSPKALQIKILNVSTGEILATDMITTEQKSYPEEAFEILKDLAKLKKSDINTLVKGNSEMQTLRINIVSYINTNIPNIVKNVAVFKDEYTINSGGVKVGDLFNIFLHEAGKEKQFIGKGVIYKASGNQATGKLFETNKLNIRSLKTDFFTGIEAIKKKKKSKDNEEEEAEKPKPILSAEMI